jgi:hypothetical protein
MVNGQLPVERGTMQQAVRKQQASRFDVVDLDTQLSLLLTILEKENVLLKSLIARRSKISMGSFTARRLYRWIMSAFV